RRGSLDSLRSLGMTPLVDATPLIRPSGTFSPLSGEKGNMGVGHRRGGADALVRPPRGTRGSTPRVGVRVSVIPSERSESRDPLRMCGARSFYSKGVPRLAALARDDTPLIRPSGTFSPLSGEKGNMSVEEGRTPSSARRAETRGSTPRVGGRVSVIPSERSESRDPLRMCGARSFYSKGVPRLAA